MDYTDYMPIDYGNWVLGNSAREGVNIKKLKILNPKELKLWNASVSFQDSREDFGHGEIVTYFAIMLLNYYKGKREIVVPAAIMHDLGWHGIGINWKQFVASGGNSQDKKIRKPHQDKGVIIARELIEKTKDFKGYIEEICFIIKDHDTRENSTTLSGKIVWAADLLWRVTYPYFQNYLSGKSPEEILKITKETALEMKAPYNLRKIEKYIGRIELVNSMFFKFGNQAKKILFPEYKKELDFCVK